MTRLHCLHLSIYPLDSGVKYTPLKTHCSVVPPNANGGAIREARESGGGSEALKMNRSGREINTRGRPGGENNPPRGMASHHHPASGRNETFPPSWKHLLYFIAFKTINVTFLFPSSAHTHAQLSEALVPGRGSNVGMSRRRRNYEAK